MRQTREASNVPVYMMIPVAALVEPETPQRKETLLERMDELRDSIRMNGLQQPIGVLSLADSTYRILFGHRRSIAVTQLGWEFIPAMVYQPNEADGDKLMGAENYHRNAVNDAEEARYYARILPTYPEGTIGMARELNVPQSRIERLLLCLEGDPKCFEEMAKGNISLAQAWEINKFESPGYRLQAIERCLVDKIGGETLRKWRQDIQKQGLDRSAAEQQVTWATPQQPIGQEPMDNCCIGNHMVPLLARKIYPICHQHYNVFLQGLECLGRETTLQEAGLYKQYLRLVQEAEGEEPDGRNTIRSGDDSRSD